MNPRTYIQRQKQLNLAVGMGCLAVEYVLEWARSVVGNEVWREYEVEGKILEDVNTGDTDSDRTRRAETTQRWDGFWSGVLEMAEQLEQYRDNEEVHQYRPWLRWQLAQAVNAEFTKPSREEPYGNAKMILDPLSQALNRIGKKLRQQWDPSSWEELGLGDQMVEALFEEHH